MLSAAERLAKSRRGRAALPPIACTLRERREALGLTREDVAAEVGGISPRALQFWEQGDHSPHLTNAYKLARFFGVSVYDLWPEPKAEK